MSSPSDRRRYSTYAPTAAWVLVLFAIATAEDKPQRKPSPLDRLEGRPGDVVASLRVQGSVKAVEFSPDGKSLASGDSYGNVLVRDTSDLEKPVVLRAGANPHPFKELPLVWSLAFSLDGKTLALALTEPDAIELWDLAGAKPATKATLEIGGRVWSMAFSPDGKTLASSGDIDDSAARLWEISVDKPKQRATLGHVTLSSAHLAFSPDGKSLAVASGEEPKTGILPVGAVTIYDPATGKQQARIEGLKGGAICVAYSTDGQMLAVTSLGYGKDWTSNPRLYDLRGHEPKERAVLEGHDQRLQVRFVGFAADGKTLVSAGWDGRVILWDPATGKMIRQVTRFQAGIYCAALAPDGRHLATGFREGNIHIVRLR
jgi:WD40 repeat protein